MLVETLFDTVLVGEISVEPPWDLITGGVRSAEHCSVENPVLRLGVVQLLSDESPLDRLSA